MQQIKMAGVYKVPLLCMKLMRFIRNFLQSAYKRELDAGNASAGIT